MFFFNFQNVKFEKLINFKIEQFRIFGHFLNQSIIAIWKMTNFP